MTDNSNGATEADAPAAGPRTLDHLVAEARRRAALRYYVSVDGVGYNADMQALFGVDEQGRVRAEGLTPEGREFADSIAEQFDTLGRGEQAARDTYERAEAAREGAADLPGAFAGAFVQSLGLARPIRAALRAAAVSFAAALDGGETDDAGIGHGHAGGDPSAPECVEHHGDGSTTVRLPAGGYVILQVSPPRGDDFPVGMVAIAAGGGVQHARQADVPDDAEGAERVSIERILSIATAALDAYTEQRPGEPWGASDGELPDEVRERAEELLRSVFGDGVTNVRGRFATRPRAGGEGGDGTPPVDADADAADLAEAERVEPEFGDERRDPGDVGPGDAGFIAPPEPPRASTLADFAGNSGSGFPISTPDAGPQCDTDSAAPTSSPAGGTGAATSTSTSDGSSGGPAGGE